MKCSVLDGTAMVIVKFCTASDVARMGTLSASLYICLAECDYLNEGKGLCRNREEQT